MFFCFFSFILSEFPIPNRPTGIIWGPQLAPIIIDFFGDPLCSACLAAWPTISQLLVKYPTSVQLRYHMLPLPYHQWSFTMCRMLMTVKLLSEDKVRVLINKLYKGDQDMFLNGPMESKGEKQSIQYIAQWASNLIGIEKDILVNKYSELEPNLAARVDFKFAGYHGVSGTPTIFINEMPSEMGSQSTIQDWQSLIDSLL